MDVCISIDVFFMFPPNQLGTTSAQGPGKKARSTIGLNDSSVAVGHGTDWFVCIYIVQTWYK